MTVFRKVALLLPLLVLLTLPRLSAQEAPMFALQWSDPKDPSRFAYQTAMVRLSESGWLSMLKRHPEGRRAIVVTHPHNTIWNNPDDRCRNADGTLNGLSASPVTSGGMFRNGTGGDGVPSGYSCPWLDGWVENERVRSNGWVDALVGASVPLNYLIFDVESKIDWLKLNKGWRTAIQNDPRWAQARPILDSLKQAATNDPSARFDFEGGTVDGHAWNAYMWAQQARALNEGIFNVFRAQWPALKGSNYEHHGRRAHDTTLETYGWQFYQTDITGTHSSDYYYGWIIQAKDANIGLRKLGEDSDWLIFLMEQRKARASVRAGYPIQPWIAYSGNENIDWRTSPKAPALHTPNPFWMENIRHLLLLEADPLLYWNSRSYKDTDHSTDELDEFVEQVLGEVNSRIGTVSPRYTVTTDQINWFSGPENDAGRAGRLPNASGVVATGLRHGNQATYRVSVERIHNNPTYWDEVTVRVLRDGQDGGERLAVPAGQTGVYFTTAYREGEHVSFEFDPAVVPNLLGTLDLTGGAWVRSNDGSAVGANSEACPVDGVPTARLYDSRSFSVNSAPVRLRGGQVYTFSVYMKGLSGSGSGGVVLRDEQGESLASSTGYNRDSYGWSRINVTYLTRVDMNVIPFIQAYRQLACAPALHEGVLPGYITADGPIDAGLIEQKITLRPGVNMVAFHVDPGNVSPDDILGGHETVTLIKNPAGEVYSTRFSIRDIQAWDALQAYRVLAEDSVVVTLKGRPLNMQWMDLEAGWNLVPYARSSPSDIAAVLAAQPGVVLRVEDDAGRLYEPEGENVTLHSFEPGRAYRIYATSAVRLTFPE